MAQKYPWGSSCGEDVEGRGSAALCHTRTQPTHPREIHQAAACIEKYNRISSTCSIPVYTSTTSIRSVLLRSREFPQTSYSLIASAHRPERRLSQNHHFSREKSILFQETNLHFSRDESLLCIQTHSRRRNKEAASHSELSHERLDKAVALQPQAISL